MNRKIRSLTVFSFVLMNLVSCYDGKTDREIWESKNISDYHMDQAILCFCYGYNGTYNVHVKADTIYSVTDTQTNEPVSFNFYSIEKIFDLIDSALKQKADVVKVEFDPVYHFPSRIEIDYYLVAFDDEITILVTNFEAD